MSHKKNLVVSHIIPGPNESTIVNSDLHPLILELQKLPAGIPAIDGYRMGRFPLRALIGKPMADQRAMVKVLHFKGPESRKGCRMCDLQGKVIPTPARNMEFSVIETHVVKLIWNRVGVRYGTIYYYIYCRL